MSPSLFVCKKQFSWQIYTNICFSKDSQVKQCHWNKNRFQAETICGPVVAFIFLSPCCRGASRKEGTRDRRALQLRRGLTHTSCCANDPSANKEHNAQVFWALLPATARQCRWQPLLCVECWTNNTEDANNPICEISLDRTAKPLQWKLHPPPLI